MADDLPKIEEALDDPVLKDDFTYPDDCINTIKWIYLTAIAIWFLLIYFAHFYKDVGVIGGIIIAIPPIIFFINWWYLNYTKRAIEREMFQGNFLSFAFLVTVLMINWSKGGDRPYVFRTVMAATFLLMLSLIDVWVPVDKIIILKHVRSIFQTSSLALLALGLYIFYYESVIHEGRVEF